MKKQTHWREIIESEYLAAADLYGADGKIHPIALTIKRAGKEQVLNNQTGQKESELLVYFEETKKPMILNVTNAKMIEKLSRTPMIEEWRGLRVEIGTQKIRAFGELWDALRISPKSPEPPKPVEVICTDCQQIVPDYQGVPGAIIAEKYGEIYGAPLCYECGQKRKAPEVTDAAE